MAKIFMPLALSIDSSRATVSTAEYLLRTSTIPFVSIGIGEASGLGLPRSATCTSKKIDIQIAMNRSLFGEAAFTMRFYNLTRNRQATAWCPGNHTEVAPEWGRWLHRLV